MKVPKPFNIAPIQLGFSVSVKHSLILLITSPTGGVWNRFLLSISGIEIRRNGTHYPECQTTISDSRVRHIPHSDPFMLCRL